MEKANPRVGLFYCFMAERSRALRALRGGFKGLGVLAQPSSNRLTAVAHGATAPRAPGARGTTHTHTTAE
jgi:hypothetical protein